MDKLPLNDLLAKFRTEKDWQDELNAKLAQSRERSTILELSIMDAMKDAGLDSDGSKVSHDGLTVTLRHKFRATYDPAKWSDIVRWAIDTHNEHIIQRRLSDRPVLELLDSGEKFPDGLTVSTYEDLDFRRS